MSKCFNLHIVFIFNDFHINIDLFMYCRGIQLKCTEVQLEKIS